MIYKPYHDDKLSMLGMGNMRLPKLGEERDAPIDYEKASEIIDCVLERGINYLDTAHAYAGSEAFLGKALAKHDRSSYKLATKYNAMGGPDYKTIFEQQLERLNTDYVDFYLIHAVMNDKNADNYINCGCIEYFQEQKAKGRIRNLGFSSHAPLATLERFADYTNWDFAQIQLNYLDWTLQNAEGQYNALVSRNIPIMVMEPVRGGRLASLTKSADAILKAAQPDWSIASWAFRWLARLPGVQVILSGMTTMEQLQDNLSTFDNMEPLTDEQVAVLMQAKDLLLKELNVPCTGCRYCVTDCPMEIDIPKVIAGYNNYKLSGSTWGLGDLKDPGPKDCVACGACAGHCPQNIAIPDIMAELAELIK